MKKVDSKILERLAYLKFTQGLTDSVIAIRLGLSERTVRVYTRALRTSTMPYHPAQSVPECTTLASLTHD